VQQDRVARPVEDFKRIRSDLKFENKVVTARPLYVNDIVHCYYRPVSDRFETSPPSTGVLSNLLAMRWTDSLSTIGGRTTRRHLRVDRRPSDSRVGTSPAVRGGSFARVPTAQTRKTSDGDLAHFRH
jgi:hypothetical protein